MLTPEQLADLRAKAEDAQKYGPESWHISPIDHKKNILRMFVSKPDGIPWYRAGEACADFCDAANPATVLQLLDMVKRLEKEAEWLANHAPEMNEYGDYWCAYRFMPQDKKCPMWTQGDGDTPEDDSLEAWKRCAFGEESYTDTVNCRTNWTKCWREAARKAVESE